MKLRLFISGILVGCAIGLMVGGAVVKVSADGSGEREYPFGPSMLLAIVGMVGAMSVFRRSGSTRPHPTGNGETGITPPAAPGVGPDR
jgi:hypothetical protein